MSNPTGCLSHAAQQPHRGANQVALVATRTPTRSTYGALKSAAAAVLQFTAPCSPTAGNTWARDDLHNILCWEKQLPFQIFRTNAQCSEPHVRICLAAALTASQLCTMRIAAPYTNISYSYSFNRPRTSSGPCAPPSAPPVDVRSRQAALGAAQALPPSPGQPPGEATAAPAGPL